MSSQDEVVQALFGKLEERKKELAGLKSETSKSWKTNGSFPMNGAAVNIQTASEDTIYECAIVLANRTLAMAEATILIDKPIPVKLGGFTPTDWIHDLKKRLATINIRSAEIRLKEIEDRLNQVLSPEERRRIEIERLASDLS